MNKCLRSEKGNLLILVSLSASIFLFIGISLLQICINASNANRDEIKGIKTFYLAEAGIEMAESKIIKNNEYFTDDFINATNIRRLLFIAKGDIYLLGDGGFKIIILRNKKTIYSIGFLGRAVLSSPAYAFLKKNINLKKSEIY